MNVNDIPFPLAGIDTRRAFQAEDVSTTVQAINIVPNGQIENRMRGGVRYGLSRRYPDQLNEIPLFMAVVESDTSVSGEPVKFLVVGGRNFIYRSRSQRNEDSTISYFDYLELISGDIGSGQTSLSATASVAVHTGRQLVLIADGAQPIIDGTNGSLASAVLTISEDTGDVDVDDHIAYLVKSGCPGIQVGAYEISSKTSNTLTLNVSTLTTGVGNGTVEEYQVRKGNKYVDLKNGTSGLFLATTGVAPQGANLVAVYRDRIVWIMDNLWYMSRQGDPYDYDYGADAEDLGRAIAGSIAEAGQAPRPINAIAPFEDDFMLMWAEDSTWVMRGDPAQAGQIDQISQLVGCVDKHAWCYGANGEAFFLSKEGLCYVPPGANQVVMLSEERLPNDLRDADKENFVTILEYDTEEGGVYIFITPKLQGVEGQHWYFHGKSKSFWKLKFGNNQHQPMAVVNYSSDPTRKRQTVLACRDSFIRTFDGTDTDDENEQVSIASELVLGPFQGHEQINFEGIVARLLATTAEDSGSITIELYRGSSAEEAADRAIAGTGADWSETFTGGRSNVKYPRVRCAAFCVRMVSTSSVWAFESLSVGVVPKGAQRI